MKTIAIISQKGGSGKTTIAVHLSVAAEQRGLKTALFDLDPQASAASWADRRENPCPTVLAAQAPRLSGLMAQAEAQKVDLIIIDSAPNADTSSLAAAKAADLILIPCRPSAFDLNAVGTTLALAAVAGKPAYIILNAAPSQGKLADEAREALKQGEIKVAGPVLHHLVAFSHAINDGRTAQEFDPRCKAASEVKTLFKWVCKHANLKISKHA